MEPAVGSKAAGPPRRWKRDHRSRWCLGLPRRPPWSYGCAGLGGHHLTDHHHYLHDWTTSSLGASTITGPVPASPKPTAEIDPEPGPPLACPITGEDARGPVSTPTKVLW